MVRLRLSALEWTGLALIVLGLAAGYAGGVLEKSKTAQAIEDLREALAAPMGESPITNSLERVSSRLATAQRLGIVAVVGFWTFLSGIAVFLFGARSRCLAEIVALRRPDRGAGNAVEVGQSHST